MGIFTTGIERKQIRAARVDIRKKELAAKLRIERDERIKTVEFKQRQIGERARKTIKQGGIIKQFASGLSAPPTRMGKRKRLRSKSLSEFTNQRFEGGF